MQEFIGCRNLLSINSYFSAFQIAFSVLNLKSGDEVIVSPMSCLASTQPLQTYGLKIIWADIDPHTGTLDPIDVKCKITDKVKLIIHNHFCGYIGYVDEINTIGKEYGIPIIDDCIEAFGSEYKKKCIGNFGTDITVYSFQTVRLPNVIEGGAISFTDKKLYDKSLLVRDFGINRNQFRDENNEISVKYDVTIPGYGATLNELNSYIGFCQMREISKLLEIQRENANSWNSSIESKFELLNKRNEVLPNYWIYGILSDNKVDDMLSFRSHGFYASGVHFPNNYYSVFGNKVFLKGVDDFYSRFIAIPSGWWVDSAIIRKEYL